MQETQCSEQGTLKNRFYYVGSNYIVQDGPSSPILIKRNGGGSQSEVDTILKMCGMKIKKKESSSQYELEVIYHG